VLLGYLIYRGALRVNLRLFFAWTGAFLVVIAAGVLAYGFHDLQEAELLPGEHALAFDVSSAVPPTSWYGTLLKGVFNFSPDTTWLQLIVWICYLVPTIALFVRMVRGGGARPATPTEHAARSTPTEHAPAAGASHASVAPVGLAPGTSPALTSAVGPA